MRIFLTGATGFLGSYLAEELVRHGHDVAVLLRAATDPWRLADVLPRLHRIEGSLADTGQFAPALRAFRPQAVAHLAWQGVAGAARNDAAQAENIVATVHLAILSAELGVDAFVGAGSQAEYGPYGRAITEQDETHPTTLYGWAKLAAGKMAERICSDRAMRFAWLRVFSTYGTKDAEHWLLPSTVRKLAQGERMPLTAGEQRWGFLHAGDAAAAFRTVIETPAASGIYNLGAAEAPRLRDTIEMLRDLMQSKTELGFGEVPYRPDQVMVLQADIARLAALGWRPQVALHDGLKEVAAWYAQRI